MAQLTIEIPDDLAERLAPFRQQLSQLFTHLIATTLPSESRSSSPVSDNLPATYLEVLDFLVTSPTPEELLGFKVSEESQTRLQTLLQKNQENSLTPSETAELNVYEQLDALMTLLKVRAFVMTKNGSHAP
jgi:hypothetical protein